MTLNIACVQRRGIDLLLAGYQLYIYVNDMLKIFQCTFCHHNSWQFSIVPAKRYIQIALNCHVPSVQGVGTRSLIHELNVKTGRVAKI